MIDRFIAWLLGPNRLLTFFYGSSLDQATVSGYPARRSMVRPSAGKTGPASSASSSFPPRARRQASPVVGPVPIPGEAPASGRRGLCSGHLIVGSGVSYLKVIDGNLEGQLYVGGELRRVEGRIELV